MSVFCPDCVEDGSLGAPSHARWRGPDGVGYCSIHFIRRFGHGEKLVKLEGYEPPAKVKPPAPKREPKVVEA
jgi:hypothetical protein